MDALRKQLAGSARYVLVNHDSIATVLQHTRSRDSVMHLLSADMNVSIRALPTASADSVHWIITLFDATSQARSTTLNVGPAPTNSTTVTDSLAALAVRSLWQLDHTPRRATASPSPKP